MVASTLLRLTRLPVDGVITGTFGDTSDGYPADGHKGTDLAAPMGTPIVQPASTPTTLYAMHGVRADGVPLDGWGDGSLGNCIVLDFIGTPWYGFLAHMQEFSQDISVGMGVLPGTELGRVGMTGKTSGPHVHFALCKNTGHFGSIDQFDDPLRYYEPGGGDDRLDVLEAKVRRLEGLIGGYGLLGPDGAVISGDAALQYANLQQFSALLSGQIADKRLAELTVMVMQLTTSNPSARLRQEIIEGLANLLTELRE